MKFKNLVSIFAALGVFSTGTAFAQFTEFNPDYSFVVGGYVNTIPDTFGQLNAGIEVDFLFNGDILSGANVKVTNYGPAESALTGFWLQRPGGGQIVTLGSPTPYSGSTDDWTADQSLPNSMSGPADLLGDPDFSNYFGASAGERLDIPGDNVGYFSFSFIPGAEPFSVDAWVAGGTADDPLLFVRWQEVYGSESGKGAGGPGFQPGVPEPSEVAALAVLGLGGILFVRRRFTKKAK